MSSNATPPLNRVLRSQLRALQINPDAVHHHSTRRVTRLPILPGRQTAGLIAAAVGVSLVLCLGVWLVASSFSRPSVSGAGSGQTASSTSVAFGGLTTDLSMPASRSFSHGQGIVILRLDVQNPTDSPVRLLAGDLRLVDAHGALFPPAWPDADGVTRDGLADPEHTLVGLDPGGQAHLDLPFLVMTGGPFTLRYQRTGQHQGEALPTLALAR